MKFEIINPSDACTMYAPDLEVAAVAVSFLGNGEYPLEGLDDAAGQGVPAFLFGGHDEWFSSKFGMSFQDTAEHVLNHRNEELATTLDSVTLRHTRSSMNDIAGRARSLAQAVRRKASSNVGYTTFTSRPRTHQTNPPRPAAWPGAPASRQRGCR